MNRGKTSQALALPPIVLLLVAACSEAPDRGGAGANDQGVARPFIDAGTEDAAAFDLPPDLPPDLAPRRPLATVGVDGGAVYRLSETGLYADIARKVLAPDTVSFEPAFALWSDGSDKRRWIALPPGGKIDTADMDRWSFPVGTRVWKEFSRGGVRLETRLIERYGEGPMDYWMGAFRWLPDGSDAIYVPDGEVDVLGTDHDVPAGMKCWSCHGGEPGRILGVSAIQLLGNAAGAATTAFGPLAGSLSHPPPPGEGYPVPGPEPVRRALGYLHANCGHCHNSRAPTYRETDQILRLSVREATPEATAIYRTSIDVKAQKFPDPRFRFRVVPGKPEESAFLHRMGSREKDVAMPPLASKHVDPAGVAQITAWIAGL